MPFQDALIIGCAALFYAVVIIGAVNDYRDRERRRREWLETRRHNDSLDITERGHRPEKGWPVL